MMVEGKWKGETKRERLVDMNKSSLVVNKYLPKSLPF